jgi:hypothetical protein
MATKAKKPPYNPLAYVPGGASKKVATAIQKLGYATAKRPTTTIVRQTTPQNSFTTIESPAQIETRVRRMADEAFTRERSAVEQEAAKLRQDAEGRRRGMAAAYEAAAKANAGMGADIQTGWNTAGSTISGLAGATTGGIQQALAADLATQQQQLERVGAGGGLNFDASRQAPVEQYRGGFLPGGRRAHGRDRAGPGERGRRGAECARAAGGVATEASTAEDQHRPHVPGHDLTPGRSDYETKLREQLLGARGDEITAAQNAAVLAQRRGGSARPPSTTTSRRAT